MSPTSMLSTYSFFGWMDDLCFYNRILSSDEIAATWMNGGNVSDESLFIYYDFDEGPGARLFRNKGVAGAAADLQNGLIFNASTYLDSNSGMQSPVTKVTPVSEPYTNLLFPPTSTSLMHNTIRVLDCHNRNMHFRK